MIDDFTDRRPVLSGVLIALLFTLVPAVFIIIEAILPWVELNTAAILIVYAIVIQGILSLKVERMSLVMLPFVITVIAVLICELVYFISAGLHPPAEGPGEIAYMFSSVLVAVFGPEAVGVVISLLVCSLISTVRELRL